MKMPKQMNIQLNGRSFRRRTKYSSVNGIQKYAAAINKSEISRRYSIRRSRLARLSSRIFAAEVAPKMNIIGRRRSPRHERPVRFLSFLLWAWLSFAVSSAEEPHTRRASDK